MRRMICNKESSYQDEFEEAFTAMCFRMTERKIRRTFQREAVMCWLENEVRHVGKCRKWAQEGVLAVPPSNLSSQNGRSKVNISITQFSCLCKALEATQCLIFKAHKGPVKSYDALKMPSAHPELVNNSIH